MWKWMTCLAFPALHSEKPLPRAANAGYTLQEEPVYLASPQAVQTISSTGNLIFQCLQSKQPTNQVWSHPWHTALRVTRKSRAYPGRLALRPWHLSSLEAATGEPLKVLRWGNLPRQSGHVIKQNPAEHIPKPVCSVDPEKLCPFWERRLGERGTGSDPGPIL